MHLRQPSPAHGALWRSIEVLLLALLLGACSTPAAPASTSARPAAPGSLAPTTNTAAGSPSPAAGIPLPIDSGAPLGTQAAPAATAATCTAALLRNLPTTMTSLRYFTLKEHDHPAGGTIDTTFAYVYPGAARITTTFGTTFGSDVFIVGSREWSSDASGNWGLSANSDDTAKSLLTAELAMGWPALGKPTSTLPGGEVSGADCTYKNLDELWTLDGAGRLVSMVFSSATITVDYATPPQLTPPGQA